MAEAPVVEVRLVMDSVQGVWEPLDGGRRCVFCGTVRLTQSSLVDPMRAHRVLETVVEWEQTTPTMFLPEEVATPSLEIPPVIVATEEEETPETPITVSGEDTVNGPSRTYSSRPAGSSEDSSVLWRSWLDHRNLPVGSASGTRSESVEDFGGSSTALSAVGALSSQLSISSTSGSVGVSSSIPSDSGPSEGGVHGWWKAGESFSSRSSR